MDKKKYVRIMIEAPGYEAMIYSTGSYARIFRSAWFRQVRQVTWIQVLLSLG